ncbi:MAG: site-specific integrase, partial [Paracoccus sp. (in: a-proteobacteria)]|nr:site-specific integrase [Paracoccus sp. (in: a-proteobacteria)]
MSETALLALAPATSNALARWLETEASTRDRSDHTITAYQADVIAFLRFIGNHHGEPATPNSLGTLRQTDMRAFSAAERTRGLGARSLARRQSAVRSFLRWLSDREGYDLSAALSARSPKYARSLPRPLTPDQAQDTLAQVGLHDTPWVAARDTAVLTLLWGSGLRISEA